VLAEGPGTTIVLNKTTVSRNGIGLSTQAGGQPSGQIISYSSNEIDNNVGADGTPTAFFAPR